MTNQSFSKSNNSLSRRLFLFVMLNLVVLGFAANIFSGTLTTIPANPKNAANVTVNFDGLMILAYGNPERVSVGLLDAMEHSPQIDITKTKGNTHTTVASIKADQLHNSIYIKTRSGSGAIKRYYGESAQDINDLRWTLDLENDIYQKQLHLNENKFFGKIHFNAGLFYTTRLTEKNVRFFSTDNSGKTLPFNRQIGEPAAKMNIAEGDALVIEGAGQPISLVSEPGVTYQINVTNLPDPSMASMEHFEAYYDLITDNVTSYTPVMARKAAFATGHMICLPVSVTKSSLKD